MFLLDFQSSVTDGDINFGQALFEVGEVGWIFGDLNDGRVDLGALLDHLARKEIAALLVEGGPTVHGSFNDGDLVDEIALCVAPFVIGGNAPAAVAGTGVATLEAAQRLCFEDIDRHGDDLEIRAVRPEEADVYRVD